MTKLIFVVASLLLASPVAFAHDDAQSDGGATGDAADTCRALSVVLQPTDATAGALHPPQDASDWYGLEIGAEDVGQRIHVQVEGNFRIDVMVYRPDCGGPVVPATRLCGKADCPVHEHDDSAGHDCDGGVGHAAECTQDDGSAGPQSVDFTPSREGVYAIEVFVAPGPQDTKRLPPRDTGIQYCHDGCTSDLSYSLVTTEGSTRFE